MMSTIPTVNVTSLYVSQRMVGLQAITLHLGNSFRSGRQFTAQCYRSGPCYQCTSCCIGLEYDHVKALE